MLPEIAQKSPVRQPDVPQTTIPDEASKPSQALSDKDHERQSPELVSKDVKAQVDEDKQGALCSTEQEHQQQPMQQQPKQTQESKGSPLDSSCENYEIGYDSVQGRAWRKEILPKNQRGPIESSQFPEFNPDLPRLDPIRCVFDDGKSVEISHVLNDSSLHIE